MTKTTERETDAVGQLLRDSKYLAHLRSQVQTHAKMLREHRAPESVQREAEEYAALLTRAHELAQPLQATYESVRQMAEVLSKQAQKTTRKKRLGQQLAEQFRQLLAGIVEGGRLVPAAARDPQHYANLNRIVGELWEDLQQKRDMLNSPSQSPRELEQIRERLTDHLSQLETENQRLAATVRGPEQLKLWHRQAERWAGLLEQAAVRVEAEQRARDILLDEVQVHGALSPRDAVSRVVQRLGSRDAGVAADAVRHALWRLVEDGELELTDDRRISGSHTSKSTPN